MARKIRWISGEKPEMSRDALRRSRAPRGGAPLVEPARCDAGQTSPLVARVNDVRDAVWRWTEVRMETAQGRRTGVASADPVEDGLRLWIHRRGADVLVPPVRDREDLASGQAFVQGRRRLQKDDGESSGQEAGCVESHECGLPRRVPPSPARLKSFVGCGYKNCRGGPAMRR